MFIVDKTQILTAGSTYLHYGAAYFFRRLQVFITAVTKCRPPVPIPIQLDTVHTPPHPTSWRSTLTFHVPNLMSLFRCLGRTKVSVQVRGLLFEFFATRYVFMMGFVSTSPNPQVEGPLLVGCRRLFIRYIRSYPPYWTPFLHPQPEDAPCRGDRDALVKG